MASNPVYNAETSSGESYYSDSRILLLDLKEPTSTVAGSSGKPSAMLGTIALPTAAAPGLNPNNTTVSH